MLDAVVVLKDQHYAKTLATIKFDRYGKSNLSIPPLVTVNTWVEGFGQCWTQGYQRVLFVRSGTVFEDFVEFCQLLDAHENQGLIGHILHWPNKDMYPMIHDQCFYADLQLFTAKDLKESGNWPLADISADNVHDDYTPLWVAHTCGHASATGNFGSGLIASMLDKKLKVVNWTSTARAFKAFLYPGQELDLIKFRQRQTPYEERITNHMWITNNEELYPVLGTQFVGPASGAAWWLNLCRPETQSATLIDISYRQLDFARWMVDTWNGSNWGEFVVMYMFRNRVMHFTLDRNDVDAIQLLREKKLAQYINQWVEQQLPRFGITDLEQAWKQARIKKIQMLNLDLISWVLEHGPTDGLWASNVSNFKYALLNHSWEDIEKFNKVTKHNE